MLLFCANDLGQGVRGDYEPVMARMYGHPVRVDRTWLGRVMLHARIHGRWAHGVEQAGGRVPGAAAVDVRTVTDTGDGYIDNYLAKSTYDVAARLGAETAARNITKISRDVTNLSPFELLAELVHDGPAFGIRTPRRWQIAGSAHRGLELVDRDTGEVAPIDPPGGWRLWVEWEQVTRGRKQMTWARRPGSLTNDRERMWLLILDARGEDAETADKDVARREIDGELLGGITRQSWYSRLVWHPAWLVDLLEAAESTGGEGAARWAAEHGIDWRAS